MSKYYLPINCILIPIKDKLTKDYTGIRKSFIKGDSKRLAGTTEYSYVTNIEPCDILRPHHLHIISTRHPQKGDWIANSTHIKKVDYDTSDKTFVNTWKIEASTDESLGLPKISLDFQKTLCELYGNMPDCFIKFSSGGYANAMHMDSGQKPDPEVVFTNSSNEIIFVAPCDIFEIADAAETYAMGKVKHIKNPVEKFIKELEFQGTFIAGADYWRKKHR